MGFTAALQRCGFFGVAGRKGLCWRDAGASRRARTEKDGEGPTHDRALQYHPADTSVAGRARLRLRGDPALLPGLLSLVLYGAAAEFGEVVRCCGIRQIAGAAEA